MSIFQDKEIITVCKADEAFPRHSEASIIERKDSSLLMAWMRFERSDFGSNDIAPSTISLMDSSDGGRTWVSPRIAVGGENGCHNVYSPNLLRLQNENILLCYFAYDFLERGKPRITSGYTRTSSDGGKTFGNKMPLWTSGEYGMPNACIVRLTSGRVILPLVETEGGLWTSADKVHVRTAYSDDDCKTWVFSRQRLSLPMRGAMEPFVAELKDGRLMMVMRTQLGSVFKSYSLDMGVTWNLPQTTGLPSPESCPNVTRIPGDDRIMVIWNHSEYNMHWATHYGKRTPLTAAVSSDGGKTFTDFSDIETDPDRSFTNPAVTWTSGGTCLLTYWSGYYKENGSMDTGRGIDLKLARLRIKGRQQLCI